jgi:hypothetical protein
MAGASAERQETAVCKAVENAVKKNKKNPVTVVAGKTILQGIIKAEKFTGRQASGSEPYTDVVFTRSNGEEINASLKGEAAPSMAGGGLRGLELAVPGLAKKFMKAAYDHMVNRLKLKPGDKVPDTYGKINDRDKLTIVIGNKAMGGPIHYMYIGSMDVNSKYDEKKNILTFNNGQLIEAKHYAKTHDLYFRLRARREDQRFDPNAKTPDGTPKIYGVSPSRGDSAGRIVVTDGKTNNAEVVNL